MTESHKLSAYYGVMMYMGEVVYVSGRCRRMFEEEPWRLGPGCDVPGWRKIKEYIESGETYADEHSR